MKVRNTFIIFLVSGFWHGANWTFIVWGGLNALYFLPLLLLKRNRTNLGVVAEGRMLPNLRELWQMGTTFLLTVLAWVFFRAINLVQALEMFGKMISGDIFSIPYFSGRGGALQIIFSIAVLVLIEWSAKEKKHTLYSVKRLSKPIQLSIYWLLSFLIYSEHMANSVNQFIYFQF